MLDTGIVKLFVKNSNTESKNNDLIFGQIDIPGSFINISTVYSKDKINQCEAITRT